MMSAPVHWQGQGKDRVGARFKRSTSTNQCWSLRCCCGVRFLFVFLGMGIRIRLTIATRGRPMKVTWHLLTTITALALSSDGAPPLSVLPCLPLLSLPLVLPASLPFPLPFAAVGTSSEADCRLLRRRVSSALACLSSFSSVSNIMPNPFSIGNCTSGASFMILRRVRKECSFLSSVRVKDDNERRASVGAVAGKPS